VEHGTRGIYDAGSRFQGTAGEDTADCEDLVRAVVNCNVCELAIVLKLIVVTSFKSPIKPIINQNPVYSHFIT
jgi:hypothetical protein